ncbi:MAG: biotin transporter BioY [Dactylosporangium sp.]|nr:biotin transporter BioY [Dactylosporangium sp.]NNJ62286.1 biotin transporter BioY [Dactylosporangium sp.]
MTTRSRTLRASDLARVAVFAALIAALGLPGPLYVPGSPVPITAQTLGVMLAGALLGARRGAMAVVTFLVLVAAGLPLLAGGRGGISWLTTAPNAGYLLAWPLGALVIGLISERMYPTYRFTPGLPAAAHRFVSGLLATIGGGIIVVYAIGIPVHAARVDSGFLAVVQGVAMFLPGDLIKAGITALVASAVHRALPGLVGGRDGH